MSWLFRGFWTARRSSGQRVWHGQPSLMARLKTVLCCAFGCSKYDKHRTDCVRFHRFTRKEEFRRCSLGGCSATSIAARENGKVCRKNTNNGEWTIHERGKSAQMARNKRFPLTGCWGRRLESAWSCPKSLPTPSRTSKWMKMRPNSGKSTGAVVDLRVVVRRWVKFLHLLDIIKTTDTACLRSVATHSPLWHQIVLANCEAGGYKSKSGSPLFLSTELQLQLHLTSTVLYSASCCSFYGVTSLLCEAKNLGENRRQTTMKKCYSIQKSSFRQVEWYSNSLLERHGFKMLRFLEKFGKPPISNLLPANRCVIDVTNVCRGRIEAALPPTFTTHNAKTDVG